MNILNFWLQRRFLDGGRLARPVDADVLAQMGVQLTGLAGVVAFHSFNRFSTAKPLRGEWVASMMLETKMPIGAIDELTMAKRRKSMVAPENILMPHHAAIALNQRCRRFVGPTIDRRLEFAPFLGFAEDIQGAALQLHGRFTQLGAAGILLAVRRIGDSAGIGHLPAPFMRPMRLPAYWPVFSVMQ